MNALELLKNFTSYFEEYDRCLNVVTIKGKENTLKVSSGVSSDNYLSYQIFFAHGSEQGIFDNIEDGIEIARFCVSDKMRSDFKDDLNRFYGDLYSSNSLKIVKKR